MEQHIVIKAFEELTNVELYEILRLRSEVFVVEQSCIYQDIDGTDPACHHVMLYIGNSLAAYSRVVPAGLSFREISLGRVLVNPNFRGVD